MVSSTPKLIPSAQRKLCHDFVRGMPTYFPLKPRWYEYEDIASEDLTILLSRDVFPSAVPARDCDRGGEKVQKENEEMRRE